MSEARNLKDTLAEFLALPAHVRAELIHGRIVPKETPGWAHSGVESGIVMEIGRHFHRKGGSGGPGGWWIRSEISVEYREAESVFSHDIAGWARSENRPEPSGYPVTVRPDWVCEVMNTTWKNDLQIKFAVLEKAGVPHYWVADVERKILTVYELVNDRYTVAHVLDPSDRTASIRPFDAVPLDVAVLFGADPD